LFNYIGEKENSIDEEILLEEKAEEEVRSKIKKLKRLNVNFGGFEGKLQELIDGIRSIPNYNGLKGYVREEILSKDPEMSYTTLSAQAGIHKGVALVILYDLYNDRMEEELKDLNDDDLDFHYG
jgi:hypothetical protein